LPLVRLKDVLKYPGGHEESLQKNKYVIIVNFTGKKMGIIVDKIYGQREILIKPPGQFLKEIQCVAGFAETDARKVIPVVDISGLVDRTFAQAFPFLTPSSRLKTTDDFVKSPYARRANPEE